MDKIWYRNPSKTEVIGRCGGDEKSEWQRRTDKSRTLKKQNKTLHNCIKQQQSKEIGGFCNCICSGL